MKHPTKEECEALLEEYDTPLHVRGHCREVARTACIVAGELNRHGYCLDLELILAAGMLHDIARVEEKHWEAGADIAQKLGYIPESRIIRVHMGYSPFSHIDKVTETDMVCLGDRLVLEDSYAGIDKRIEYIINKARKNGHPEAEPIILEKKRDTERFLDEIKDVIGMSVDELMAKNPKWEK